VAVYAADRPGSLASERGVSVGTAHRAVSLLAEGGYVEVVPGRGFRVVDSSSEEAADEARSIHGTGTDAADLHVGRRVNSPAAVLLDFAVRHRGQVVARFSAAADPRSAADLRQLLVGAIRRCGSNSADITDQSPLAPAQKLPADVRPLAVGGVCRGA
jgi:hypothetical protein